MAIAQNVGALEASVSLCDQAPEASGSSDVRSDKPQCRSRGGNPDPRQLQQLRTADPLADRHLAITINAVNLKYRLRNINTNCANLAHLTASVSAGSEASPSPAMSRSISWKRPKS